MNQTPQLLTTPPLFSTIAAALAAELLWISSIYGGEVILLLYFSWVEFISLGLNLFSITVKFYKMRIYFTVNSIIDLVNLIDYFLNLNRHK